MNYNYYDNFNTFNGLSGIDNLLNEDYMNDYSDNNFSNMNYKLNKNMNNDMNYSMNNEKNYNMYNGMNNDLDSLNLYEPLEGYTRGNLFKDLYDPYKNYRPQRVSINSEEEELLTSIGEYSFAAHELNLYLDVYPNNQKALNLFNKYREQANELMMKYERKYGPLTISSKENQKIPFPWEANSWPWGV